LGDHPAMDVVVTKDAHEFAGRARGFLQERIEQNILATVLTDVLQGRYSEPAPLFGYATDAAEAVVAAAIRTPPRFMLASDVDRSAAGSLVDLWLAEDPELPGVAGTPETTRAIAAAWVERTGGATTPRMRMALHDLPEIRDPPRPAPGQLREPRPDERTLMIEWFEAFGSEADAAPGRRVEPIVDARLADGLLLVWDDDGPVSLVGLNAPVGGVVRLGPVFTPPEHRRRGYAGTAVAVASRLALAGGAHTCILYSDLLNPTSNKIYAEVGYRRVADWEELAFEHAQAAVGDNPARKACI
jgi:predicted GNAT family acetyltransferase